MTQTLRRTPRPDLSGVRLGVVYGYRTYRVNRTTGMVLDGTVEVGYVGQTVQPLEDRDDQHRGRKPGPNGEPVKCQPFSDVIHGDVFIIEANIPVGNLDEREAHHIAKLMPVYNHQLQTKDNPNRIQISEARRHRDARDLAKGLEPRKWPALRNPPKFLKQPSGKPARKPWSAKWRRRRNWTLAYAGTVTGLWLAAVLFDAAVFHLGVPALGWLDLTAGVVSALYVKLLVGRKKHRKVAWVLVGVATVVAGAWIAGG